MSEKADRTGYIMKKILSLFLIACLLFSGCSKDAKKVEETEKPFSPELETLLQTIEPILSYDNLSLLQDGDFVVVQYWYDGLSGAVSQAKSGDANKIASWEKYVANEKNQCETLKLLLESEGYSHSVSWNVLDDQNKEEFLLTIIDGDVIYDSVK